MCILEETVHQTKHLNKKNPIILNEYVLWKY